MRRTLAILAAFALLTSLVFAGEFPDDWTWHRTDEQRARHAELIGKPMPALELSHWINGPVTADDMKGKIVVLDFWATWCGPCLAAIPHNNELAAKYKDKGVVFVGVCGSTRGQEKFEDTAKAHNIQYATARDENNTSAPAFRVMWWPTYAFIDRKGIVRIIGVKTSHVEDVIEKLLAEDAAQQ